jgi:hypothetical protein
LGSNPAQASRDLDYLVLGQILGLLEAWASDWARFDNPLRISALHLGDDRRDRLIELREALSPEALEEVARGGSRRLRLALDLISLFRTAKG